MFDIPATRGFYLDFLGFTWDWEHRFAPDLPLYAQVSLGGTALHLSQHHGDATPGSGLLFMIQGIEGFHAALIGRRYGFARPALEDAPWGARILRVQDPAGNRLTFNEPR
ncbi:VOC family protein [Roseomonas sp. SSH11]|uniref:Bleomycin resistance protein n=2 Tax=Pararoseomonas baculiformis TaxID=2820812 RepID=A0ABS4A8X1_9PROT|nr:VOC family protein [Pararoseomonas baculiformis]